MAAAASKNQASKIARSVRAASTDSTIADLPGRATTESATAVRSAALKTGLNFTGQYLYDKLIIDGEKADMSKMEVVRAMVQALDVEAFRKAVADFVGVAKGYADNAVTEAKKGAYDEKNPPLAVRTAKARLKTAQNHQTVMRLTFGALKFAPDELAALGATNDTGYQIMRELSIKALDAKGINWDGTKAAPKPTPEQKQAQAIRQEEARLLAEAMADNQQKDDEDRGEYFARLDKIVSKKQKELAKERHEEAVQTKAKQVRELLGDDIDEVLHLLLNPADEAQADKNLH